MNIEGIRGDDNVYDLTLFNADGQPLNLASAALAFSAKRNLRDTAPALVGDASVTDAAAGEARVTIPAAATEDFPATDTTLHYDLQVTLNGVVSTPLRGVLKIVPDVTV